MKNLFLLFIVLFVSISILETARAQEPVVNSLSDLENMFNKNDAL